MLNPSAQCFKGNKNTGLKKKDFLHTWLRNVAWAAQEKTFKEFDAHQVYPLGVVWKFGKRSSRVWCHLSQRFLASKKRRKPGVRAENEIERLSLELPPAKCSTHKRLSATGVQRHDGEAALQKVL
ncbi:hypothetical protein TNCV_4141441 [Trichonephila clavipes]|nr:hypothetical protein TNCV_4141441 [Trichonephila clavipes]